MFPTGLPSSLIMRDLAEASVVFLNNLGLSPMSPGEKGLSSWASPETSSLF